MAYLDFDPKTVDTTRNFDALPAGSYLAMATSEEVKKTRKGDGEFISFVFEILEGEFKGRKIFDNLNYKNPSAQTVAIAQKKITMFMQACNVESRDTKDLLNIPVIIKLKVKKGNEAYPDDSNEVTDYLPCNNGAKAGQSKSYGNRTSALDGQPLGSGKPPWQK